MKTILKWFLWFLAALLGWTAVMVWWSSFVDPNRGQLDEGFVAIFFWFIGVIVVIVGFVAAIIIRELRAPSPNKEVPPEGGSDQGPLP